MDAYCVACQRTSMEHVTNKQTDHTHMPSDLDTIDISAAKIIKILQLSVNLYDCVNILWLIERPLWSFSIVIMRVTFVMFKSSFVFDYHYTKIFAF